MTARSVIRNSGGAEEEITSKVVTTLRKVDLLRIETAGTGGHGGSLLRDKSLIAEDMRNDKVSAHAVREIYGLAPGLAEQYQRARGISPLP